jgi:ribulose-phosphate 3-epimerase
MKNNHIIPTVFSHGKEEFKIRFDKLVKVSKKIQIDFMDGKFVRGKSVKLEDIPILKNYRNEFEAHLMVDNPSKWVELCSRKGFRRIIVHVESRGFEEAIKSAKKGKMQVFIAVNPSTRLKKIYRFITNKEIGGVLLLGVNPGKEGQRLSWKTPYRIRRIKKMDKNMIVQVDGGVNDKNIGKLAKYGADYVNSGSFVFNSQNPKEKINVLESIFVSAKAR